MKHSRLGDTGYWIEEVSGIPHNVSMTRCADKGGNMLMFNQKGAFPHVYKWLKDNGKKSSVEELPSQAPSQMSLPFHSVYLFLVIEMCNL